MSDALEAVAYRIKRGFRDGREYDAADVLVELRSIAPAWRPIDTLQSDEPDKFRCLVWDGDNVSEAILDVRLQRFFEPNAEHEDDYMRELYPTHWMPLPKPPLR